jgi:prepilin-type N-terminal cleavage/methylation domain-containing protein
VAGLDRLDESEAGFTLVELLWVMAIAGVLLTLGAFAVRQFWMVRSLQGAQDMMVTQLRQVQQRSVSESYPKVYGVAVLPNDDDFSVVRGNATDNSCVVVNRQVLDGGVKFTSNSNLGTISAMTTNCRTTLGNAAYVMAFMYPKGSSSVGSTAATQKIEMTQPGINRTKALQISPLTGRVTRV